jgi:hypothetical protein
LWRRLGGIKRGRREKKEKYRDRCSGRVKGMGREGWIE